MITSQGKSGNAKIHPAIWYALLLVPFFIYLKTLAPTIVLGDTGDFITAAWIHGVAHPPGYPLYTMLLGLFLRIPFHAEIAWRAGLLSMIFSMGTLALLFALVNRLTRNPWAGLIAAGALAGSRWFWWHSVVAENDSLTSLFIVLVFFLAVRLAQEKKNRDIWLLGLTLGLAISHHQSIILFIPAILLYLLLPGGLKLHGRQWAGLVLAFIIGFAPLLYLPIVSYRTPEGPVKFVTEEEYRLSGDNHDVVEITTPPFEYFMDYVGRGIYSRIREFSSQDVSIDQEKTTTADTLRFYKKMIVDDFSVWLVIIGIIALIMSGAGLTRKRADGDSVPQYTVDRGYILLGAAYLSYFAVIHLYPSGDILNAPFYNLETAGYGLMLPVEVIFAALIGLGFSKIIEFIDARFQKSHDLNHLIRIFGIMLIIMNGFWNYQYADRSREVLAFEYTKNALDSSPENGVLVIAGDELYAFYYTHYVYMGGLRSDVKLVSWSDELESLSELADTSQAMASAVARIIDENPGREVCTTFFNTSFLTEPGLDGITLARRGLLFSFITGDIPDGLVPVADDLSRQTSISYFNPGIRSLNSLQFLMYPAWTGWPPQEEVKWRIGEMWMFYATEYFINGEYEFAKGYIRDILRLEPDNQDAIRMREFILNQTMDSSE